MFVGNDFIPHLPTVNIQTGGMEALFLIYKQVLPVLDGYVLGDDGRINFARFQVLCQRLAEDETEQFVVQFQFLKAYQERAEKRKFLNFPLSPIQKQSDGYFKQLSIEDLDNQISCLRDCTNIENVSAFKRSYYMTRWQNEQYDAWQICIDYVHALQWVVNYYYQGCCSWSYYYPHHYAPLLSDMAALQLSGTDYSKIYEFNLSEPFKPFEQLLAVLPIASNSILPAPYRELMESPQSALSQYYPEQFVFDMNLSVSPWEGIALLPFINGTVLKSEVLKMKQDGKYVPLS